MARGTVPRSHIASIVETARAAFRLDVAAALLAFEPALFRAQRRLGRTPRGWAHRSLAQQFDQPVDGVGAVALLGAETLRMNHDHAVLSHALAGKAIEPKCGIFRQHDPACVETQLCRGRELVDVLPAGAGSAHERYIDVVLVDR